MMAQEFQVSGSPVPSSKPTVHVQSKVSLGKRWQWCWGEEATTVY